MTKDTVSNIISNVCIINCIIELRERSDSVVECLIDSRPRGRGFEPHRRHCVVVLEQDTFILA